MQFTSILILLYYLIILIKYMILTLQYTKQCVLLDYVKYEVPLEFTPQCMCTLCSHCPLSLPSPPVATIHELKSTCKSQLIYETFTSYVVFRTADWINTFKLVVIKTGVAKQSKKSNMKQYSRKGLELTVHCPSLFPSGGLCKTSEASFCFYQKMKIEIKKSA